MTIFAIELALLRLADLAHERAAERFSLVRVAGRANFCAYIGGVDGSAWLRSPRDRAFARCRLFRWRRRLRRSHSIHAKSRADCRPRPVSADPRSAPARRRQSDPQMRATPRTRHRLIGFGQRFLNPGPGCGPVWRHCRSIEHSHVAPKDCHPDQSPRQPLPSQRRRSSQAKGKKRLRPVQSVDDGTQSEGDNLRGALDTSTRAHAHS